MAPFKANTNKMRHDLVFFRDLWQERDHWFKGSDPPEVRFRPQNILKGSRSHAMYLFLAAYLSRSGKPADTVIKVAGKLAEEYPELIDPALSSDQRHLFAYQALEKAIPYETEVRVNGWFTNLYILRDIYDSDPANIFKSLEIGTSQKSIMSARSEMIRLLSQKNGFYGFGHKIAQMLFVWYQVVNWQNDSRLWTNLRKIPAQPVDIHAMRFFYQLGWIESFTSDKRDAVSKPLSDIISEMYLKLHFNYQDWHDTSQALWRVQSDICANYRRSNPANSRKICVAKCPVVTLCTGWYQLKPIASTRGDANTQLTGANLKNTHQPIFNIAYLLIL